MNSKRSHSPSSGERPLLHGVDWALQAGVADEIMLGTRRRVRRRRQKRLAVIGTVAALMMVAFVWFIRPAPSPAPVVASSAVLAVPAQQVLPDGSKVDLNEGAEISVAYTSAFRRVVLVRGEAHFEVMPNKARPFIVAVEGVEVRAVGTAFSVQRRPGNVEVLVTHGRVAVDRVAEDASLNQPAAPQTVAMLDAGYHTRVEMAPGALAPVVEKISPEDMDDRLGWRVPLLEFTRTPLAEAIPMINQHSAFKLSLADPALGELRISGLLHVDNIESLLRLLELEYGLKAERREAGAVVLRAAR